MKSNYEVLSGSALSKQTAKWIVLLEMDRTRRKLQTMIHSKIGRISDEDRVRDVISDDNTADETGV
jgi:hypothetical protein